PVSAGMTAGRLFVMHELRSRALGALYGLAIGDALGMPAQSLPRAEVVARYGALVGGFHAGPPGHPLAAGLPAGSVTDDTEQAVMLARLVVAGGGEVDAGDLARDLLAWEESMRARGTLDLLGPSTRQALGALAGGADVAEAGRAGLTNGAAMRVAPVGIATPSRDPGLLEDRVVAAGRLTHNTGVALAGAAAVAMAVSAGIDGDPLPAAIRPAAAAPATPARRGQRCRGCRRGRGRARALGRRRGRGRADHLGHRLGHGAGPKPAHRHRVPAGGHRPGHPGVGSRGVRRRRRLPKRPLARLPHR